MSEQRLKTLFNFVEKLGVNIADFARDYRCSYVYSSAWSPGMAWLAFRLCTSVELAPLEVIAADTVILRAGLYIAERQLAIDVVIGWNIVVGAPRLFSPEVI